MRKLVCAVALLAVFAGVSVLTISPVDARGCNPDPNPDKGRGCSIHCPPCTTVVCTPGGRCPFSCEPVPGCTP
jgi:hypothetical protein